MTPDGSQPGALNVVFVNPPIRLPKAFAHYPMFSTLGMLQNAAWLRAQGHPVRVVDAFTLDASLNVRDDGDGFRHIGAEVDALAKAAAKVALELEGPVTFVVTITMFSDMNRMSENTVARVVRALHVEAPGIPVGLADLYICGMNYFPFDAAKTMRAIPQAAWLLIGEAEPTLPELCRRLAGGLSLEGVPRFAWRAEGESIRYNPEPPPAFERLDELPLPAFDLLDMDNYFSAQADAIRHELVHEYHLVERQLPMMTSRSCPYRCNFCTNQVLGLPWRSHSVEYVRNAVRTLRERYGADRFLVLDDNINVDEQRFRELVVALAGEKVPWDAVNGYRADHLDREMVRAIKAAGNTKITVSAESGDPELLKKVIRKGLKLSAVIQLAQTCEEERIPLQVHYIVGVPGETKTQINQTLEFATMLFDRHGAWPLLQHAIPFPGTQLFRDCEEQGLFVAPPFEVPGSVLEVESIIRTPQFDPGEVIRMKRNAQHLHAAMQRMVYVDVETRCDNDCLACHCLAREPDAAAPGRAEIRKQLERALFLGGRELFLGGGEPTLRPDLHEIVAEARELGLRDIGLVTNGHGLASAERAARLVDAGVSRVVLDLLGPNAEVHDAIAGKANAFVMTIGGLRRIVEHGLPWDANIPITRPGLGTLAATVGLARRSKARSIHLQLPAPDSRAARSGEVPRWEEALPSILQALAEGPRGVVSVQGAPLCLMPDRPGTLTPLPPWELQRSRAFKVKHPHCRECVGYILCGGFFRSELEPQYGVMLAAGV
jgi:MoaA/NifB/PqqE/SkfB family radical SAM enzyme